MLTISTFTDILSQLLKYINFSILFLKAQLKILTRPKVSKYCIVYACQVSKLFYKNYRQNPGNRG